MEAVDHESAMALALQGHDFLQQGSTIQHGKGARHTVVPRGSLKANVVVEEVGESLGYWWEQLGY